MKKRPPASKAPAEPAAVLERLRAAWSRGGRAGGLKGGKARWKGTTAEERSANARKAALTRWRGKTAKKK